MKKHLSIVVCAFAALFLAGILYRGDSTPSAKAQSEAAPAGDKAAPTAKTAPAGDKGENDERQIKVFTLLNADVERLTKAIQPLFADAGAPPTVIVCDNRTNSIIARGRTSELVILEALVLRLDEAPNRELPK